MSYIHFIIKQNIIKQNLHGSILDKLFLIDIMTACTDKMVSKEGFNHCRLLDGTNTIFMQYWRLRF